MEKKNRDRGENWTAEEKEIFIDIMKHSARIIECKNTDTNTNKRKEIEWCMVQKKFQELTGKIRAVAQLKGFWRRTRMQAKKNLFQHKRALQATGGGDRPPSPSQADQTIMEICPSDFIIEENKFDSDGIFYKDDTVQNLELNNSSVSASSMKSKEITITQEEDRTLILDINDELQEEEYSYFEETMIENLHNNEATKRTPLYSKSDRASIDSVQCDKFNIKDNMSTPCRPNKIIIDKTIKPRKTEKSHKASIVKTNIDFKEKTFRLLEEEHALKMQYHRQELCHQELKHKLEIEILMIEKEKKELELKTLKK